MTDKIKPRPKRRQVPDPATPSHKLRYKFKPGFASKVRQTSRKSYRAKQGSEFELTGNTVIRSLETLDAVSELLPTTHLETGVTEVLPIIRPTVLAKLLDTSYQTIWRWSSDTNQLPAPVLSENTKGRERPVYHAEEVRVMVQAIGKHLNEFKYYRKDHTGTRDEIFNKIEALRNNNYGVTPNGNQQSTRQSTSKKANRRIRRPKV